MYLIVFSKQVFSLCWFWEYRFCFLSLLTTTWRIFPSDFFTLALRWKRSLFSIYSQKRIVIFPRLGFSQWIFFIRNPVSFSRRDSSQWCLGPSHYWAFPMTDTPKSVGLLWTSDQSVGTSTWHKTQLSQETAILESERPQTHTLDRAVTGIGRSQSYYMENWYRHKSSAASSVTF